ncbi:Hypothetical predicted protein [Olea europaea subsp. europaea]|uniref:Uncharacterized protein n=1 Tax=Olea europaea subsp. europaea TaxID=158383 RepID=A0A8S0UMS7_OLEEU|nr:Hypothetical predicted protein [Olea europaea subsp. europaea]
MNNDAKSSLYTFFTLPSELNLLSLYPLPTNIAIEKHSSSVDALTSGIVESSLQHLDEGHYNLCSSFVLFCSGLWHVLQWQCDVCGVVLFSIEEEQVATRLAWCDGWWIATMVVSCGGVIRDGCNGVVAGWGVFVNKYCGRMGSGIGFGDAVV